MIKKILIAYDGGDESHSAFLFGLEMAGKFGAQLEVLSVVPSEEVETRDNLEKLFKTLRHHAHERGMHIKTEVALGHPAEQIIHWAEKEQVDVIVIGHKTKNTLGQGLLGSVPDRVVHHAPCTVIVVKLDHHKRPL